MRTLSLVVSLILVAFLTFTGTALAQGAHGAQDDVILEPITRGGKNVISVKWEQKKVTGRGLPDILRDDAGKLDYKIVCGGSEHWNEIKITRATTQKQDLRIYYSTAKNRLIFEVGGTEIADFCKHDKDYDCEGAGLPEAFSGEWTAWTVGVMGTSEECAEKKVLLTER